MNTEGSPATTEGDWTGEGHWGMGIQEMFSWLMFWI